MKEVKELAAKRKKLLQRVLEAPLWVNGSIVETTRKVRGKETPFSYLSRSIKGKNKITYISAKHLESFKEAAINGVKLKELLAELGSVNVELLKARESDD